MYVCEEADFSILQVYKVTAVVNLDWANPFMRHSGKKIECFGRLRLGRVYNLFPVARADSVVERIDPLHFLAGCRTGRINQALSVLSLILDFLNVSVLLLIWAPLLRCVILCHLCVLSLGCSC